MKARDSEIAWLGAEAIPGDLVGYHDAVVSASVDDSSLHPEHGPLRVIGLVEIVERWTDWVPAV